MGTFVAASSHRRALALRARPHLPGSRLVRAAGRRSMASAIESSSEHDRGASRTPNTTPTVARLRRSTSARTRRSLGGKAPFGDCQSDSGWDRGRRPRHRPARLRSLANAPLPRPTGSGHLLSPRRGVSGSARGGTFDGARPTPFPAPSRGPLRLHSREGTADCVSPRCLPSTNAP